MLRNKRIIFILLTLLLLALNVLFVALEWRRTNLQLRDSLAVEGQTLQAALDVTLETTFHNMLQLATVIAEDQRVQQLFQAGKHAVAQEGGGAGGPRAAAARQELLQLVLPMWQKQMRDYGARQLHFQLGPGSLSFLRVHQPDKFGDRMDQVRHTIVDVNRDHKPRSGFETGRIYSGLRGVVPVWSSGDEKQREFLGALEVGTSFDPVLKTLDNRTGRGAAVLLNRDQVDQNMWQEFIKRNMLGGAADAPDSCYIEASSRPEVIRLLRSPSFKNSYRGAHNTYVLHDSGQTFAITRFPLFDYKGLRDGHPDPVGSILLWSDITSRYTAHRNDHLFIIIYAIGSFLLFELLLIMLFRFSCRQLQKTIDEQTAKLTELAEKNTTILHSAGDGIIGLDQQGCMTFANRAAEQLTGWSIEEMSGRNIHDLFCHLNAAGERTASDDCLILRCCRTGGSADISGELFRRKDGSSFPVEYRVTQYQHEVHGAVLVFRDITERQALERKVRWMAYHDSLTGLLNRTAFDEKLTWLQALARREQQQIALLYIDLDGFKSVNDRHGHDAGDQVLYIAASRLLDSLREVDLLARIGGDEFIAALLVEEGNGAVAEGVAQRMLDSMQEPFSINNQQLELGVSIGIAHHDPHGSETIEQTRLRADQALYQAKQLGKHRYVVQSNDPSQQ